MLINKDCFFGSLLLPRLFIFGGGQVFFFLDNLENLSKEEPFGLGSCPVIEGHSPLHESWSCQRALFWGGI